MPLCMRRQLGPCLEDTAHGTATQPWTRWRHCGEARIARVQGTWGCEGRRHKDAATTTWARDVINCGPTPAADGADEEDWRRVQGVGVRVVGVAFRGQAAHRHCAAVHVNGPTWPFNTPLRPLGEGHRRASGSGQGPGGRKSAEAER